MLNPRETQLVLERFFKDCNDYWLRTVHDEREAFQNAIDDIKHVKKDPYVPCGETLDIETKEQFIKYRELDLR